MKYFTHLFTLLILSVFTVNVMAIENQRCSQAKQVRYSVPLRLDNNKVINSPINVEYGEIRFDKTLSKVALPVNDNSSLASFIKYFEFIRNNKHQEAYDLTLQNQTLDALVSTTQGAKKFWGGFQTVKLLTQVCLASQDIFIWQITKYDQQGSIQRQSVSFTPIAFKDNKPYIDLVGDHAANMVHQIYHVTLENPDFHNAAKNERTLYQVPLNDSGDIAAGGMTFHFNAKMVNREIFDVKMLDQIDSPELAFYAKSFQRLINHDIKGFISTHTPRSQKMLSREFKHNETMTDAHIKTYQSRYVPLMIYNDHFSIISYVGSGGYEKPLDAFYNQFNIDSKADKSALKVGLKKYAYQHGYVLKDSKGDYAITNARYFSHLDQILDDDEVFISNLIKQTIEHKHGGG